MPQTANDPALSALEGHLVVEDAPKHSDGEWVLRDTESDDTIEIWPSEVPHYVALLRAFEEREGGRSTRGYEVESSANEIVAESSD